MTYQNDKTKFGVVTGRRSPEKTLRSQELRREQTPAEIKLWYHLRANRLAGFAFRRQVPIDGFVADFYCHSAGLVIELDGPVHDNQRDYDAERDRILSERGLRLLRFPNDRRLLS